jgi:hypothetical protein
MCAWLLKRTGRSVDALRPMDKKERKSVRGQRDELLTLVNGWDPAGLIGAGAPRNEYDSLVDRLLGILSGKAGREEVAEFLGRELREHFEASPADTSQFATKAVTWYALSSDDGEPEDTGGASS